MANRTIHWDEEVSRRSRSGHAYHVSCPPTRQLNSRIWSSRKSPGLEVMEALER